MQDKHSSTPWYVEMIHIKSQQMTNITNEILQEHSTCGLAINTLRLRQNGRHFPDDIFKCIFLNQNVWVSVKILLTFVPNGPINYIPALVQIMAWRRPGYKPLTGPMLPILLTHICVTRTQWVNIECCYSLLKNQLYAICIWCGI